MQQNLHQENHRLRASMHVLTFNTAKISILATKFLILAGCNPTQTFLLLSKILNKQKALKNNTSENN